MVNYTDQNKQTFKIHFILMNQMKKVIQCSIENEIKKKCKCQPKKICRCIYDFFEANFKQTEIEKRANSNKKNYLQDLDSKMSKYFQDNQCYPNDLSILDFTALICISRNLLKINPNNSVRIIQNFIEKEIKKKENCQCQANNCQCISNFFKMFSQLNLNQKQILIYNQQIHINQNIKDLYNWLTIYLQNNQNNYPNSLNYLNYQQVFKICEVLLIKNPAQNDWLNLDLKDMSEDLEFRNG